MFLNSVNSEEEEIERHVINVGHLSCSDVICVEFSLLVYLFIYLTTLLLAQTVQRRMV
jgi:hypothetical protein